MTPEKEALAFALHDVGAVLDKTADHPQNPGYGGFRLKLHETQPDAPLSPYFLMLRTPENKNGPLTPEVVDQIGAMLYSMACEEELEYDHVVGVPRAGDPFADAFAKAALQQDGREVPVLRMGKVEGDNGRKVEGVQGSFVIGDWVLLLDDLITKAHSKFEAIQEAQKAGLIVSDVMVLVDREQGGVAGVQQEFPGTSVHVVFTITDLLTLYLRHGRIDQQIYNQIVYYLENN